MNNNIKEILENLGFEQREIKIYLVLIKEQGLTALEITKKTGIDRTTIYDLLDKLTEKGIASQFIENKAKHFNVLSPEKLNVYFKEKYSSLEKILPELNQISKTSNEEVKCELFSGKNGLKNVIKDLVEAKINYKVIGIRKEYEEIISYLADQGMLSLNESNIKETAIVEKGIKFTKLKNGNYRYLDNQTLPPITTIIYNEITLFFIWQEPYFTIRIKNKIFTKAQEENFNLLWRIAK